MDIKFLVASYYFNGFANFMSFIVALFMSIVASGVYAGVNYVEPVKTTEKYECVISTVDITDENVLTCKLEVSE